jgi:hypothetical protein
MAFLLVSVPVYPSFSFPGFRPCFPIEFPFGLSSPFIIRYSQSLYSLFGFPNASIFDFMLVVLLLQLFGRFLLLDHSLLIPNEIRPLLRPARAAPEHKLHVAFPARANAMVVETL